MSDDQEIPESVQGALFDFHSAISNVEEVLAPFFSKPLEDIEKSAEPLQKAKLEMMAIFAANSLQWMYMCTRGETPIQHPILDELTRIKKYMDRLKELEDRVKAPKINKQTAKSFIRGALWEPNNNGPCLGKSQDSPCADVSKLDAASSSNGQCRDLVEEQLDQVLKRCKEASKHKRFSDSEDDDVIEVPVEGSTAGRNDCAKKTEDVMEKKKRTHAEIVEG